MRFRSTSPAARYIVISTQGRGDEAALLAALAVDAEYIAFVGSRKKAEALKASLAGRGISRGAARQAQGARRSRSRRNHSGGNCNLDSGRDCCRAAPQGFARQSCGHVSFWSERLLRNLLALIVLFSRLGLLPTKCWVSRTETTICR